MLALVLRFTRKQAEKGTHYEAEVAILEVLATSNQIFTGLGIPYLSQPLRALALPVAASIGRSRSRPKPCNVNRGNGIVEIYYRSSVDRLLIA